MVWGVANTHGDACRRLGADHGFSAGGSYAVSGEIEGTTDDALYRNERYGDIDYAFAVPAGTYTVTLKFAEIAGTSARQGVFDVYLPDAGAQPVLDDFDILRHTRPRTALDRSFAVTVTDGWTSASARW